jgi:hypothetical protein
VPTGVALLGVASLVAAAAVALATDKTFLEAGQVRTSALLLSALVGVVGIVTVRRGRRAPSADAHPLGRWATGALGLAAVVAVGATGLFGSFGRGNFCATPQVGALATLASMPASLAAIGTFATVRRGRSIGAAAIGVLLAMAPLLTFHLARLSDPSTCGG